MQLDARRKQIIYRANHRGIKEMDLLLGRFARDHAAALSERELDLLESLMEETDRDLLSWFTGEAPVPARLSTPVFKAILKHQKNNL